MLLGSHWPAHTGSRRSRKPARTKPFDPRKTVKRTPREKYGLSPRTERVSLLDQEGTIAHTSRGPTYSVFYKQLAEGTWPRLHAVRRPNKLLYESAPTAPAATVTPGLKRKVCPAISTTNNWTRLQRKVLPKFLLVLDDTVGLLLLRHLSRLQPQSPAHQPAESQLHTECADAATVTKSQGQEHQSPSDHTAAAVPTSITGARNVRHATNLIDRATADAAAVSRGFEDAADERAQFELMLTAVYAVFQHKLHHWDGRRLMKALGYVARLQLYHHGFMQAWFLAAAPHLQRLPMQYVAVCLEALARLGAAAPSCWLESFVSASQGRLQQLSLQQQALLLVHIADLQVQLPNAWWQEYCKAALQHAMARLRQGSSNAVPAHSRNTAINQDIAPPSLSEQGQCVRQELLPQGQAEFSKQALEHQNQQVLSRPAADALCSMLWSSSKLPGQPFKQQDAEQWLVNCLDLLLPALAARRCSTGAGVQLLQACSLGTCQELPIAAATSQACLEFLLTRLGKVCSGAGLHLLVQCLLVPDVQQQLPPGFCGKLEVALVHVIVGLPTQLLIELPSVFGACQHKPGMEFMSAYVLTTSQRLTSMSITEIASLVGSCADMAVVMPSVWVVAVLQQLQQHVRGPQIDVGTLEKSHVKRLQVAKLLTALQQIAADWTSAQAASAGAAEELQCFASR